MKAKILILCYPFLHFCWLSCQNTAINQSTASDAELQADSIIYKAYSQLEDD